MSLTMVRFFFDFVVLSPELFGGPLLLYPGVQGNTNDRGFQSTVDHLFSNLKSSNEEEDDDDDDEGGGGLGDICRSSIQFFLILGF
jgi:hypothetical protein